MINNQMKQKAGDGSQQYQADTVNIINVNGIDEKRAREIFNEMYVVARKDFTQDAYECANQRVSRFEKSLMPKIIQIDGALEKFADPSFQILLAEAHRTAASSEREADYDLLSELLVHRIQRGEARKTRAGIKRAIEIVDQIDDDALCAITITHAVEKVLPVTGIIGKGLDVLQDIFDKLEYMNLPEGKDWIEHLEILNAVRIDTFSALKKVEDYYTERLDGYVCTGIKKHSSDYDKAMKILDEVKLPDMFLVEHELLSGYVRLPIPRFWKDNVLSDEQCKNLKTIHDLYDKTDNIKQQVREAFIDEWKKRKALRTLLDWWDSIPISFDINAVGTVLAHANAQRCNPNIPPLKS